MESALPPANISPLIKGARWSLLLAGVFYGAGRYNMLMRKERKRLEELERTRAEREAKILAEKEKRSLEEIENLSKELGQKI